LSNCQERSEQMEADIIKAVYNNGSYAHAENILIRLRSLEQAHPIRTAVEKLYTELDIREEGTT
jgi:hypothetical protein